MVRTPTSLEADTPTAKAMGYVLGQDMQQSQSYM